MARLFLLLGGNMGNKRQLFEKALSRLGDELGEITQISSIYETEPWGFQSDDLFWNQVVVLNTGWSPEDILKKTQAIELELGRTRKAEQYVSRLIDIDLLFYNDLVLRNPYLELPHPRMVERRFVLEPLSEIAPNFIHPVFNQSIKTLLKNCSDPLQVMKLPLH